MTAILDKVAAGELLGRRQDMAANQLLSHALEQLLARSKRLRDTEAATMNMQLVTWRDGRAANEAMVAGSGRRPAHLAPAVDGRMSMRRSVLIVALRCVVRRPRGHAQVVVYDPAVTCATASPPPFKEYLADAPARAAQPAAAHGAAAQHVHESGKVPAARPAALADARLREPRSVPATRTAYHAALNYGDAAGAALPRRQSARPRRRRRAMAQPARRPRGARCRRSWRRWTWPTPQPSPATHDTGRLRYNGRRELQAIDGARRGRHRRVARAERDRRARQDQRRRR